MILRFLRRWRIWLVLLTLAGVGGVWWWRAPRSELVAGPVATYVSYASLMSPFNRTLQAGALSLDKTHTSLDFWLSDAGLFDRMLVREGIYAKLESYLRRVQPALVPQAGQVSFLPVYQNDDLSGEENKLTGELSRVGISGLFEKSLASAEADYAQIQRGRRRERFIQARRPTRIAIQSSSTTSEGAQVLAEAAVAVLREELARIAVKEVRARRQVVEQYIRTTEARMRQTERVLARQQGLELEALSERTKHLALAVRECIRLESEIQAAESQMSAQRELGGTQNPAQAELTSAEQARMLAQRVYQPDSRVMVEMDQRVEWLRRQSQRFAQASWEQSVVSLRATVKAKRRSLELARQERDGLLQDKISDAQVRVFRLREKELTAWDAELLTWRRKWIELRLQERLCQGDGAWVLLQSPRPGTLTLAPVQHFLQSYSRFLAALPLAPLFAVAVVLALEIVLGARRVRYRAAQYLDAPVLGEMPSLSREYRSRWQSQKRDKTGMFLSQRN